MPPLLSLQELTHQLHSLGLHRNVIPLECRRSWWVPLQARSTGHLYMTAFYYPLVNLPGGTKQVGRPRFQITLDATTGALTEMTDCDVRDFAAAYPSGPIVGTIPAAGIGGNTGDVQERYAALQGIYDRLLAFVFVAPEALTAEQRMVVTEFRKRFQGETEPCLEEFYRALNPEFFAWLEAVAQSPLPV